MGRTRIMTAKMIEFLLDKPEGRATSEILDYVNASYRYGATSQQIGNVLAKSSAFQDIGTEGRHTLDGKSYQQCVWVYTGEMGDTYTKYLSIKDDGSVCWRG